MISKTSSMNKNEPYIIPPDEEDPDIENIENIREYKENISTDGKVKKKEMNVSDRSRNDPGQNEEVLINKENENDGIEDDN
ncbi:MAG TPA: hypothetical protein PKA90_07495 [Ignavibacteria bacterium]|nr:hypothetical protein [Ignavibacteria bacterium]HMR40260.1 hypothetical protein [Ignavibacteria bacterium]